MPPRKKRPAPASVGLSAAEVAARPSGVERGGEGPPEIAALEAAVLDAGGQTLASYRDPFAGHWLLLAALPIDRVAATTFQRDLSVTHVERLVGVINLDGAMPFYPLVDVIGYGTQSSTLGRSLKEAAASLSITVSPDLEPGQQFFTRSDHYPFVRRGIPGIFLIAGNAATPDGKNAREINERWSQQHLHQPSDDLNQPFDYGHMMRWAELFRRWTEGAANANERPFWYEGDYFGQRFAPEARKVAR